MGTPPKEESTVSSRRRSHASARLYVREKPDYFILSSLKLKMRVGPSLTPETFGFVKM